MIRILTFIAFLLLNIVLASSQTQFVVEKLPINTNEYDEMSPIFYKDGLVFCSNKKNNVIISYTDTSEIPQNLFDLYFTKIKDGKKWTVPNSLSDQLNTLFQEGPCSFYKNNSAVVLSRNIFSTKKYGNYMKDNNSMGLYFAKAVNDKWLNIEPFEYNSKEIDIIHPSITEDGKTLYFASNMAGGMGGFDIWVCYFKGGKWLKPQNLGSKINSAQNEAFPFIHPNGRLYFASKGWSSKGGYDIFFSQIFGNDWLTPQNMQAYNSTSDDFGYIADKYFQTGYFTSNRGRSDDIYIFKSIISEFENCGQQQKNNYCYIFYENGTSESDITGSMRYEWDLGDGTKVRALEAEHCFEKPGTYNIKLNVIDSLTGEVYFSQAEYKFDVEEIEQPFITANEVVVAGENLNFNAFKSHLKYKVAKYYWDFDDGIKAIGADVNHVFYQDGVYDVKLQVESTNTRDGIKKACVYKSIIVKSPNN